MQPLSQPAPMRAGDSRVDHRPGSGNCQAGRMPSRTQCVRQPVFRHRPADRRQRQRGEVPSPPQLHPQSPGGNGCGACTASPSDVRHSANSIPRRAPHQWAQPGNEVCHSSEHRWQSRSNAGSRSTQTVHALLRREQAHPNSRWATRHRAADDRPPVARRPASGAVLPIRRVWEQGQSQGDADRRAPAA
jgi:hypothetical protein